MTVTLVPLPLSSTEADQVSLSAEAPVVTPSTSAAAPALVIMTFLIARERGVDPWLSSGDAYDRGIAVRGRGRKDLPSVCHILVSRSVSAVIAAIAVIAEQADTKERSHDEDLDLADAEPG
ncbi:hypothetical protein [Streptomyces mangrovisoli]|uniref:Uncharacterized protein n=1 Tax=Streptomyces mangrovisoli TaxID=1428628 RepID=A0A1J4NRP9_9ACTN|nr:hypothetical protein [Streptomyces mangrovisoli]OIJ64268.1 hypothetical protein WN71_029325 [Streptomyces mangrovisoli]